MFKKMLLSSLAGIFATALFLVTPSAEAACFGFCADILLVNGCQRAYTGCAVTYDANGNPQNVTCYYQTAYEAGCWEPPDRDPFTKEPV